MKMLDRYILRSFLTAAFMWFVVLMALRIVVDLCVNMDEFAKLNKSFWDMCGDIVTYYSYHSLVYFIELGGIIIVVSAAFTLAMMNHTNELTAMMASGVSLPRVALPIIVCSMLLGGLIVADEELVIPKVADKLVRNKDEMPAFNTFALRLMNDSGDSHCVNAPEATSAGSIWYSPDFSAKMESLRAPVVLMRDGQCRAVGKIIADWAYFDECDGRKGWRFVPDTQTTEKPKPGVEPRRPQPGCLVRAPQGQQAFIENPDAEKIVTQLGPEQIIASAGNDPQPGQSVLIKRVELIERSEGMTIQGRFESDPVAAGQKRTGRLVKARFIFRDSCGQELGIFRADEATWVPQEQGIGYWKLSGGDLFYATDLTPREIVLRRSHDWIDYLSTSQLSELLELKRVNDPYAAMMTRHVRAVEPINNLIMLLLGLPFILSRERNVKASAGLTLLVCGGFYAFIYICRYVGLPPDLAAWLPVLLFGSVASVTMYSVKT